MPLISTNTFTLPSSVKSFSDYFTLPTVTRELVAAFGYTFGAEALTLPEADAALLHPDVMENRLRFALQHFDVTSEITRREFLIAPVLFEIALNFAVTLRSEYSLRVTPQLKGTLDYLLQGEGSLLVVEAKQADMTRGFMQLAAELIALDKVTDDRVPALFGAVTVGSLWQFGILYRAQKHVMQDLQAYTIPTEVSALLRALVGIPTGKPAPAYAPASLVR